MMIDMSYAEAMANGEDVWCDFAEQVARTRDGFCIFCGSTEHKPIDAEPEPAAVDATAQPVPGELRAVVADLVGEAGDAHYAAVQTGLTEHQAGLIEQCPVALCRQVVRVATIAGDRPAERGANTAVRSMLDLATAHLPAHIGQEGLNTYTGVIADPLSHGWLLYVPLDPQANADDYAHDGPDGVPPEVLTIQLYARTHGCDYVLLDADGPHNPDLPSWDW